LLARKKIPSICMTHNISNFDRFISFLQIVQDHFVVIRIFIKGEIEHPSFLYRSDNGSSMVEALMSSIRCEATVMSRTVSSAAAA